MDCGSIDVSQKQLCPFQTIQLCHSSPGAGLKDEHREKATLFYYLAGDQDGDFYVSKVLDSSVLLNASSIFAEHVTLNFTPIHGDQT